MPTKAPSFNKNGRFYYRCTECQGAVPTFAKRCPHCGASFANEDTFGKWYLFFMMAIICFVIFALIFCSPGILLTGYYGYYCELERTGFVVSSVTISIIIYVLICIYTKNPKFYCTLTAILCTALYIFCIIKIDDSKITSSFIRELVHGIKETPSINITDYDSNSDDESQTNESNANEDVHFEQEDLMPNVDDYDNSEEDDICNDEEIEDESQSLDNHSSTDYYDDNGNEEEEPSNYDTAD